MQAGVSTSAFGIAAAARLAWTDDSAAPAGGVGGPFGASFGALATSSSELTAAGILYVSTTLVVTETVTQLRYMYISLGTGGTIGAGPTTLIGAFAFSA